MLENVTVIIPAHNRPERLRRLLDYYEGSGIRILIPDSSNEIYTGPINKETTLYLHRPGVHQLVKIKEVLPMISTPYALYCADDDFAIIEGIKDVVDFLDGNPDYSVAQGHYLTFTPREKKGEITDIRFSPRYIRYFDSRVDMESPSERLRGAVCQYASFLYGVTRTEHLQKIYGYCFDSEGKLRFTNLFLAEEFFNRAMMIMGKYATIPTFFSAREYIEGSATDTTVSPAVIKTDPRYKDEFDGFIYSLASLLSDSEHIDIQEAGRIIREVSVAPSDTAAVGFKRKVNAMLQKNPLLRPLMRLSSWRYRQKGLKAVQGMQSYPLSGPCPAREAIEKRILATNNPLSSKC